MIDKAQWVWASLLLLACGGESGGGEPAPASTAKNWQDLVAGEWQVPAGEEIYLCARTTLDRDLMVGGFEAINPPGTHHTVLTVGPPSGPDGLIACDSFEHHATMVFGSGVGTNTFELPQGVAVRLQQGQQLLLNLHLFNTGGSEITGNSGTRALVVESDALTAEAESILAGTFSLNLPPKKQTLSQGTCTINTESTLFAIQPHMHQLGSHMKVVARVGGEDRLIWDGSYDFGEQPIYPMEDLRMMPGDTLHVECTHDNTTDAVVTWGESSKAEMCHAGVYRYPAANDGPFFCGF